MKGFRTTRYLEGHISRITPAKLMDYCIIFLKGILQSWKGNEIVEGEVVEPVDEKLLALDWLEDYDERSSDNLYKRVPKTVFTDDGRVKLLDVYLHR